MNSFDLSKVLLQKQNHSASPPSLLIVSLLTCTLLQIGCSSAPQMPYGLAEVRNELNNLQANGTLAALAPVAITEAQTAVRNAENAPKDAEQAKHLVYIANRKVNIAWAQAQSRQAQDQFKLLTEQQSEARLTARTLEVDDAQQDAGIARQDAKDARQEAQTAREQSQLAQTETQNALLLAEELTQQIELLNARQTDRGLVVTLGDLLFDTDKSKLKQGTHHHLTNLAAFLNKYPKRNASIEGHTDSVGAESYNLRLSEQRADSVRSFLLNQGILANRLTTSGKGESVPIAGNDNASGRQQNRRVEVLITEISATTL